MNREILFRAKRVSNGMWVEGDLTRCILIGEAHICRIEDNLSITTHRVDFQTICQYTGLTDKNGRKIFEGDIVNCAEYECCGNISWNESEAGFYFCVLLDGGGFEEENLYDYVDELEVIGNIFDNPELLEGCAE